ncbi:MAG: S1/P1 nuclease, partial [Burkholderiales bacterium]|nr:S1/P1 nuclease [Burkholderiales bacterium]
VWADCAKGVSTSQHFSYPSPGSYAECAPLETPARIAEMADYVRRNTHQCTLGIGEDTCHKQMHYADVALQRSRYLLGFTGTRPDDVVGALQAAILVLQGKPAPAQPSFKSPREALLVLTHLVGDIHQPLHVGSVYLDAQGQRVDPDKKGGLDPATFTVGGNSLYVVAAAPVAAPATAMQDDDNEPDGPVGAGHFGPLKLHAVWDGVPDKFKPKRVDAAWLAEARKVRLNQGDPIDWPARWATQSLDQAGLAFEGLKFSPKQGSHWTTSLPSGYSAKADSIKRQQLTAAGARLAFVLKAVFAD